MRVSVKFVALVLMLLALLVPLTSYASGGKCPDDPELSKTCDQEAPPFYVVINRDFEALDRPGTGCQPIILDNPECETCCGTDPDCQASVDQIEDEVCPMLAERYDWADGEENVVVYQMCCDCEGANGTWLYMVRLLYPDGSCPYDEGNQDCYEGLPPGTGVDLPAPVVAAGLAVLGAAMLGVGLVVRRRSARAA